MKISKIFLLPLFLHTSCALADICSETNCPNGREATDICIVDPQTSGGIWKPAAARACGYFTEKIITNHIEDVARQMEKLAKECKSLDSFTVFGHGSDGSMQAGGLGHGIYITNLSKYACLFNANAKIKLTGCNVGSGCQGDLFLYETAISLLPKGGSVTAPTFYASTALPGIWPHTSLNLKDRVLYYDSSRTPPDNWSMKGLALTTGGDINERCAADLRDALDDYTSAVASAKKNKCIPFGPFGSGISEDRLNDYEAFQRKLSSEKSYLESISARGRGNIFFAINFLRRESIINRKCKEPSNGLGNTLIPASGQNPPSPTPPHPTPTPKTGVR